LNSPIEAQLLKSQELEQSLRQAHEESQSLWVRLTREQEKERGELAHELHDEVGQMLVALGMNFALLKNRLPDGADASLSDIITDSRELLKKMNERVRDVMGRLRPPVLDDYGLVASLKWYAGQYSKRTGIPVELRDDGHGVRLPGDTETALFRVAQEAMANIDKHANATRVLITIISTASAYRITITDDGAGFDIQQNVKRSEDGGWGLIGMKERARGVGGQFAVKSSPGDGTQVIVEVESVCGSN
jgi:signal transduction histidine kinase